MYQLQVFVFFGMPKILEGKATKICLWITAEMPIKLNWHSFLNLIHLKFIFIFERKGAYRAPFLSKLSIPAPLLFPMGNG